jgi:hypothetical protein
MYKPDPNLRHHRAGHLFSFHRGDPYRTLLPRTLCGRLDVAIDLLEPFFALDRPTSGVCEKRRWKKPARLWRNSR